MCVNKPNVKGGQPVFLNCIPWKDSRGKLIPCQVHHCGIHLLSIVASQLLFSLFYAAIECTTNTGDVCGIDGKTYSSQCRLYEAGTSLGNKIAIDDKMNNFTCELVSL